MRSNVPRLRTVVASPSSGSSRPASTAAIALGRLRDHRLGLLEAMHARLGVGDEQQFEPDPGTMPEFQHARNRTRVRPPADLRVRPDVEPAVALAMTRPTTSPRTPLGFPNCCAMARLRSMPGPCGESDSMSVPL